MDAIKHLIGFFLKIASTFFFVAIIWWLVALIFPGIGIKTLLAKNTLNASGSPDWIPSPRKYSSLFNTKTKEQNEYTNLYIPAAPYSGYSIAAATGSGNGASYTQYQYVRYSDSDPVVTTDSQDETLQTATTTTTSNVEQAAEPIFSLRSLYIRNLSIYEGGHIYTGISFVGEARSNMFREGKFPIIMVDQAGRAVGIAAAIATTDWSVPGWVRFESKIPYTLPNQTPCTMVFEEALTQQERVSRNPLRVSMAVRCN
jgi:hypothetical protein